MAHAISELGSKSLQIDFNRKHKIAWGDAVYRLGTPLHEKKNKESIYINALDGSVKHTKIMNIEKGVKHTLLE